MTIKTWLESNWWKILIVIALLFIGWWVFFKKNDVVDIKPYTDEISQLKKSNDSLTKVLLAGVQAKSDTIKQISSSYDSLVQKKHEKDLEASASASKIRLLSYQLDQARKDKDTSGYYAHCDSLQVNTIDLANENDSLKTINDGLVQKHKDESDLFQQNMNTMTSLLAQTDSTLNKVVADSGKVADQYKKVVKKEKTNLLVSKIFGGIILVLSGIVVADHVNF